MTDQAGAKASAVLAGTAQRTAREDDLRAAPSPLDLLESVSREAVRDAGVGDRALGELDAIGFVDSIGWQPRNGPRLLAERLGIRPRREIATAVGGESPLALLNFVAREIQGGRLGAALLVGTHNLRTRLAAHRRGLRPDWERGGAGEPERLETTREGHSALEARYGLDSPRNVYPLFENALRARRGLDLAAHREGMGRLMSRFSEVAARNPHAWFPVARDARELVEVTDENRMIGFPYPKFLNAVIETDQAAAVLLLSAEKAADLGIPAERQVHWWGGGGAVEEPWFFSERAELARSPALAASAHSALAEAGVALDEIGLLDLYSCFPVAVEMACDELGLAEDDPRGFTVTGGLPYAGGPGNDYCMHAVAATVERLRADGSRPALITGNGWYFTKHAASVLGATPRRGPGPPVAPAAPGKPVVLAEEAQGPGRVEGYTVLYDREGPSRGIVIGRLEDGRRFLANTPDDRRLLEAFVEVERCGSVGQVTHRDGRNRFDPS